MTESENQTQARIDIKEILKEQRTEKDINERINAAIDAIGAIPSDQKISILFLAVDRIYEQNKHLNPALSDLITFH